MTNTVEHTPGPWNASGRFVYSDPDHDGNECEIARCGMADSPRNDADARLIASAPELLAACEMMLPLFEEYVIEHESPKFKGSRNFVADARAQLNGFKAAITKAKGQP